MEGCFTFTPTTSRIAFKREFRHIPQFSPTLTVELLQVAELLPRKNALETPGREREREVIKKSLTTSTTTTTREDLLISYTIIRAGSSQRSEHSETPGAQASSWRQLCIYYTFRYLSLSPLSPPPPTLFPFPSPPFRL
jgi:hypothetical protein